MTGWHPCSGIHLLLTGVKVGCGEGQCGACNVIVDDKLIRSCVTKMSRVPDGAAVTTIEGVGTPDNLHPIQLAWMIHGGAQCGFCTPGFIVSAKALLDANPSPTREDIRQWFQKYRNACRCTGYKQLVDAVMDAARVIKRVRGYPEKRVPGRFHHSYRAGAGQPEPAGDV